MTVLWVISFLNRIREQEKTIRQLEEKQRNSKTGKVI